jgi:bifunctional UDP-N-acetylglucosamine pyrophosphorylase/glucosamine-1-phosphate N-acetyltransferase
VGRENRKGEYYLNEVLPILMDKGERVSVVPVDTGGTFGVNSRDGLAAVERVVRRRINAHHLNNGVTMIDPDATYIDVDVRIGRDTVIRPMTFLEGGTVVGKEASIGPSTRIVDSRCSGRGDVRGGTQLDDRHGRPRDPFVRMRPGTVEDGQAREGVVDLKNGHARRSAPPPSGTRTWADVANVFGHGDGPSTDIGSTGP